MRISDWSSDVCSSDLRFEVLPTSQIRQLLPAAEPGRAVTAAAALLSNLSQFAGVVLAPKRAQVFRQIEFIRLSDKRVLLIIVTPDGDVQNRLLFVSRDYLEQELLEDRKRQRLNSRT